MAQPGAGSALTRTLENSQLSREELDWGSVGDWLRVHVDSAGEMARIGCGLMSTMGTRFSALVGAIAEPSSECLTIDGLLARGRYLALTGSLDCVSRLALLSGSGQVRVEMVSIGVLSLGVGMTDQGRNNKNIELYEGAPKQDTSEMEKK